MNQIKAKVYYLISTGEVLAITPEMQGCVEKTTKEQDMQTYNQLKDKNTDGVDFIELEYGTLVATFNNVKTYKVNIETKQLELTYLTQEELNAREQQNQEAHNLDSRVSDISTYLSSSDEITIAEIENSILEVEKNKILEGMM